MAPSFLLSLVASSLLLAAVHVKADDPVAQDPAIQACSEACVDYSRWAYDCARHAGCFDRSLSQEAFADCWEPCDEGTTQCHELCLDNYEDIVETCDESCEDKWRVDMWCEDRCFRREFLAQYQSQLPDLTPHDTGIWQGIWDNEEEEEK